MANGNEGSTPALGDAQARKLLEAPPAGTLKRGCILGLSLTASKNFRLACAQHARARALGRRYDLLFGFFANRIGEIFPPTLGIFPFRLAPAGPASLATYDSYHKKIISGA
jgi:hypothetical protein